MATIITKIQDVRVGDIFLGPIGGLTGAAIGLGEFLMDGGFRVGTVDVRHAGIVVTAEPGLSYPDPPLDYPDGTPYPAGVLDHFELAQAMPKGAETTVMTYAKHWNDRCLYARLPEDYPGQAQDAAAIARLMVSEGLAYSFASYAALAAWHWGISTPKLEAWIGRRRDTAVMYPSHSPWAGGADKGVILPVEAICSVFVDQAWSLTGKKIFDDGRPHQCVTPSQLAQRLLSTDGVVLGWPNFYPYRPVF
jgi:hypothetical protein